MFKSIITGFASLALIAGAGTATTANAAPCRDAKGKFIKCPKPASTTVRCRGAKGRFVKCGTPGSKPA